MSFQICVMPYDFMNSAWTPSNLSLPLYKLKLLCILASLMGGRVKYYTKHEMNVVMLIPGSLCVMFYVLFL